MVWRRQRPLGEREVNSSAVDLLPVSRLHRPMARSTLCGVWSSRGASCSSRRRRRCRRCGVRPPTKPHGLLGRACGGHVLRRFTTADVLGWRSCGDPGRWDVGSGCCGRRKAESGAWDGIGQALRTGRCWAALWAARRRAAALRARLKLSRTRAAPRIATAASLVRPAYTARTSWTGGGVSSRTGTDSTDAAGFSAAGTSARAVWQCGHRNPEWVSLLMHRIIPRGSDNSTSLRKDGRIDEAPPISRGNAAPTGFGDDGFGAQRRWFHAGGQEAVRCGGPRLR